MWDQKASNRGQSRGSQTWGLHLCGARNRSVVRNGLTRELDLADLGERSSGRRAKYTCDESREPGRLKVEGRQPADDWR
jgi:hypothetical protein